MKNLIEIPNIFLEKRIKWKIHFKNLIEFARKIKFFTFNYFVQKMRLLIK